jgi:hypothetical protein
LAARILYKYVPPERIDVLLKRRIRFTQPCFLNDPFEFTPGFPADKPENVGHFEAKIARERGTFFREQSRICGVLSLVEGANSIPMWTHYAAGHTGFVIGFDAESGLFSQARVDGKLDAVKYRLDRPSLTRGAAGPDEIFMTKSSDWAYEREWRWIERRSPFEYAEVVAAPNGELLFLRPIPPRSICELVLGCRVSRTHAESIQALTSIPDYAHVKVLKAVLNPSHYRLDLVQA